MTIVELEALAERVTFRDWEPHFKSYGMDFLFYWTDGEFKTLDTFVGGRWVEGDVTDTMRKSAVKGCIVQAGRDFRVEPRGK